MRSALALALLLSAALVSASDYKRTDWPQWLDADHDCQNTRTEVLIAHAVTVTLSPSGCTVASGVWVDPYSGETITDPKALDIDHVVPLQHVHTHGGAKWSRAQKARYANNLDDPNHLQAVSARLNRQKGSQSPATWRPPDHRDWCQYGREWLAVKVHYHLWLDADEAAALIDMERTCTPPPP